MLFFISYELLNDIIKIYNTHISPYKIRVYLMESYTQFVNFSLIEIGFTAIIIVTQFVKRGLIAFPNIQV